ncbi:helix-turn-helix domain-containing protein [Neobacillus niacini]|uniref:helix-turn-helix domain-containing protein n=1 Tax=Neobacillus niacini TaxID=86668 RepID=UPI0021CB2F96|nr:helix-turn-helix domain-containing protein [Neobacillus niacini]MCM3764436.1 helix-turn-helix domain-containing protein [Neobacillus niacini]
MIQSIHRALTIIDYLSKKKSVLGVTELAEKLGLNKSSISDINHTSLAWRPQSLTILEK